MRRLLPVLGTACGLDLPVGWEDAEPIDDFSQSECEDDLYDTGFDEAMSAWAEDSGIRVEGEPLHFRCDQEVEGFYRVTGEDVDVLVQPRDMHPSSVTRCDCAYRVEAGVPEAPPATVTLWRRWDDINDPNDPVQVGSAAVDAR